LREEAERLPDWEPTFVGVTDSEEKLRRKSEELSLADQVICPSRFVRDSLPEEARKKCLIAEFGSPSPCIPRHENGPRLRILFAGAMSQRKDWPIFSQR